jgi:capsular polysaccharide export protein
MNKKNILFISLFNNQSQYFHQLDVTLQSNYNIFHLQCKDLLQIKEVFSKVELSQEIIPNDKELNEIIYFYKQLAIYKKLSIRRKILMNSYFLEKKAYLEMYNFQNYYRKNQIHMVCVWNGSRPTLAAAIYVARKMGIKTLFFENGLLPKTTTVDSKGVNFKNSLVGLDSKFFSCIDIETEKYEQFRKTSLVAREKRKSKSQVVLQSIFKENFKDAQLPEKFIFLPFQVHDDTQILLFSPNIATMSQLLETVWQGVNKYNEREKDNLRIVVKEHPSDFGRVNYNKLKKKFPKVIFVNDYSTEELIKKSQGVITINSSVGIEALFYYKQVFTLGNAFYNIPGIVTSVPDHHNLSEYLDVINTPADSKLIDKFLFYLRYSYLVDGSWREADCSHLSSIKEKVEKVLKD